MNLGRVGCAGAAAAILMTIVPVNPASAAVDIWPTQNGRTLTILPSQRVNLSFPVRYRARAGREYQSVKATLDVWNHTLRKQGISLPVGRGESYVYGRMGSGTYTLKTTYRFATRYRLKPRYETVGRWREDQVLCTLQRSGRPTSISSYVSSDWDGDGVEVEWSNNFNYLCRDSAGSSIYVDHSRGEYLASPLLENGRSRLNPAYIAFQRVWFTRPKGSAACADGTVSTQKPFFCVEDLAMDSEIRPTYHNYSRGKEVVGYDRVYYRYRKQSVSLQYQIRVA